MSEEKIPKPTRDDVLRNMLRTPPAPHKPSGKTTGGKITDAEELKREMDKGADGDLKKIARIIGNKED